MPQAPSLTAQQLSLDPEYEEKLLEFAEDDFSWLGFEEEEKIPYNYGIEMFDLICDQKDPKKIFEDLIVLMMNPDYFGFTCKVLLNITLPSYQCLILRNLWKHPRSVFIATRGGSKSFILAVYGILKMIFDPGSRLFFAGAGLRQSRMIWDYMSRIYQNAPILQDIVKSMEKKSDTNQGPKQQIDCFQFLIGNSISIFSAIGDGSKIRGYRANIVVCDEFATIDYNIYNEVLKAFGNVKKDPVEAMKFEARKKRLAKKGIELDEDGGEYNQIILSGTPQHEFNHFFKEYKTHKDIIETNGDLKELAEILKTDISGLKISAKDYCIIRIPYTAIPEGFLDEKMIQDSKANMPSEMFNREYGSCFTTDSTGFYRRSVIEAATCTTEIQISSGERVKFDPNPFGDREGKYIMGVDTAIDRDNTAIVIIQVFPTHKRVVYCWTFNKEKFQKIKADGEEGPSDQQYEFIARKIKNLMKKFSIYKIMIDKFGGGEGVMQMLASDTLKESGIGKVLPIIQKDKKNYTDNLDGEHIIEPIAPNSEINSVANNLMLSDLQQKRLLFPAYDPVEIERQILIKDARSDYMTDLYEDVVIEIEDLKQEMELIRVTPTARFGHDHFDVPSITVQISGENKKQKMRKDRYSALLYANYGCRTDEIESLTKPDYVCYGTSNKTKMEPVSSSEIRGKGGLYYGRGFSRMTNK